MEKYLAAAETIAKAAIFADPLPKATVQRFRNEDRKKEEFELKRSLTFEADYEFRAGVAGRREPQDIVMSVDSKRVKTCPLSMDPDKPRICDLQVHLAPGEHAVTAMLIRDESVMSTLPPPRPTPPGVVKKPPPPAPNPTIDYIETRGPYKPSPPPLSDSEKRIFACGHARGQHTPECSRMDVASIARLAYRRPVTLEEVDALVRFVDMARKEGDSFEQGMRVALAATLVSPHFLFRIEHDPNPGDPIAQHRVTDLELASRLSYFLWSSTPAPDLPPSPAQPNLHPPATLAAEVRRMLQDPKSSPLVENFGGQWLELRNLASIKPDPDKFPEFTPELRNAMRQETTLFFN